VDANTTYLQQFGLLPCHEVGLYV